jgi:hypothetical protein
MNIDDFSRFQKTFYSSPNKEFSCKIMINPGYMSKDNNNSKDIIKSSLYVYDCTDGRIQAPSKGAYIYYDNSINFQNDVKVNKENQNLSGAYYYLRTNNFYNLLKGLNIAKKWLTLSEYEGLYTLDKDNNIVGLTRKDIHYIVRERNKYLSLSPAVIFDNNSIGYQGIEIRSDTGLIGYLTAEEYLNFYLIIKDIINNFTSLSLNLFNLCINAIKLREDGGS